MEIIPLYKGKRKNILVIGGGGIKGLCALGALTKLYHDNIIVNLDILAGTSVGAIICFLINIGYRSTDIYDILEHIDFSQVVKYDEPENLFNNVCFGISSPEPIMDIIYSFMKKKNIDKNITFDELYKYTNSKLIITGSCINDLTIRYFSVDTYPSMSVLKALRISISIPFIFKPYLFENKYWIDGGCMNNYPIDLFIDKLDDVIGIYLDNDYDYMDNIEELQDYFFRVLKCIYRGIDINKIELFKKNTVHIITKDNIMVKWEITQSDKKKLFDLGFVHATEYIQKFI
jgi:NTE family protein